MHILSSCKVKARRERSLQEMFFTFCGRQFCQNSTKQIRLCIERGVFGVDTSVEVGNHLDSHVQKRIWNQVWSVCLLLGFVRTLWSICSCCTNSFSHPSLSPSTSVIWAHTQVHAKHTMVCDASRFNALIRSSRLSPPITWSTFFKLWCASQITCTRAHTFRIEHLALSRAPDICTKESQGGREGSMTLSYRYGLWYRYTCELFIEYCKWCVGLGVCDTLKLTH